MARPAVKSTKFWVLVILAILLVSVLGTVGLLLSRDEGSMVCIYQNGTLTDRFPLDQPLSKLYWSENGGRNVVVIEDGKVSVTEADCPDQVCVRHGPTDQTGDPIVCLPHKLVVEVVDPDHPAQLDGVS